MVASEGRLRLARTPTSPGEQDTRGVVRALLPLGDERRFSIPMEQWMEVACWTVAPAEICSSSTSLMPRASKLPFAECEERHPGRCEAVHQMPHCPTWTRGSVGPVICFRRGLLRGGRMGHEGKTELVYLKWASHFGRSIRNFSFP